MAKVYVYKKGKWVSVCDLLICVAGNILWLCLLGVIELNNTLKCYCYFWSEAVNSNHSFQKLVIKYRKSVGLPFPKDHFPP